MDVLNQYDSSDSEDSNGVSARQYAQPVVRQYKVDTAPDTTGVQHIVASSRQLIRPEQREMMYNMGYEQMTQPLVGPSDSDGTFASKGGGKLASGTVERQAIEESIFRQQERMFKQQGRARDPSVGAQGSYITSSVNKSKAGVGSKRKGKGDPGVARAEGAYQGPWTRFEGDSEKGTESGPTEEQVAEYEQRMAGFSANTNDDAAGKNKSKSNKSSKQAYAEGQEERTVFHAQSERDYQGRTYMHVPAELQHAPAEGEQTCVAPSRRLVKEWKSAHAGGASAIRFIPQSGHLLLSCGMDGLVKIFDAHTSLKHLRTYVGHSKAVRDISFAPDGRSFLSSSYDGYTKLWDTETGKCTGAFTLAGKKATPNVARFYPEDTNVFLAGLSDKRIVQWDIRASETTQEYNQHLGAVNSLTFFDSSRRFVSTSDDKTMRVWEYGIPVVIKLIADAAMYSVPAVALHPGQRWFVGQSMDNRIVVYGTGERIKQHKRKQFEGHLTAGFACQPSFSPDGSFLTSGDSEGQVWCWDWQTTRVAARWKAHDKVAICTAWHPRETSRLATCSWDGSIKYWD
ncbi:hypothetical protein LPJ59_000587 [Coemansia sp. RSA 2399]|nr:hypothetical protein LPJ59_000587 [Coemansia sp. RSA 2399]KAJ1907920.1 hypothetical protein LPJ81_000454 [Coemansia sp. IMI 209127]